MVCSEKLRRWSSSSIILRRWVTGTPPVTHIYIKPIEQPTLHYLTRSVRRRAATSKRRNRTCTVRCDVFIQTSRELSERDSCVRCLVSGPRPSSTFLIGSPCCRDQVPRGQNQCPVKNP